jgi:GntR family transcriptional regulator
LSPLFTIDPHNGVPAYRQIVDQVKFQVAAGVLPAGTEMPSTRGLSEELRLNPMTISKAYARLEMEGVLERRRGQTLIVREQTGIGEHSARVAPLRDALLAAAAMARQLRIPADEALRIFQALLTKNHHDD